MTGRRITPYVGFGVLIYLTALMATVPAPWASRLTERLSSQRLQLRDPIGTAWAGSGQLYLRKRSGDLQQLGGIRWKTSFLDLWKGRVAVDLALGDTLRPIRVNLAPNGVLIRDLNVEIPARLMASASPLLENLRPEGKLVVHSSDLRIESNSILGLADIEWQNARLAQTGALDLGSYRARFRGDGSTVEIELATKDGPVRLSGLGTWTFASGLTLSGAIEHGPNQPTALSQLLSSLCAEYREARCVFRLPASP